MIMINVQKLLQELLLMLTDAKLLAYQPMHLQFKLQQ